MKLAVLAAAFAAFASAAAAGPDMCGGAKPTTAQTPVSVPTT
jgi:hypothetical protein